MGTPPIDSFEEFYEREKKARGNGASEEPWTLELIRASDIKPEPISWLWPGYLARGKLHLLVGMPDAGKTTIAMKMAATISAGGRWPDGTAALPGNVVVWSGEDDLADTLVPRLESSGADMSRVFFANKITRREEYRPFDPAKDIPALEAAIERAGGAAMIIIDPIVSATSGDSHKNSETRRGLQPVVDLAVKCNAALLGIHHFTKRSEGAHPIDRITGSVAFGAVARIVMIAAKGKDGSDGKPGLHSFMRAKSNIGPNDGGFNYDLQEVPMRSRPDIIPYVVSWGGPIQGNARDILHESENVPDKDEHDERREAADFLMDFLCDGPKSQKEIKEAAEAHCHSWATVRRAQKELGIKPSHPEINGPWMWALPPGAKPKPQGAHQNPKMLTKPRQRNVSILDEREHLGGLSETLRDKNATPWSGNSLADGVNLDDGLEGEI